MGLSSGRTWNGRRTSRRPNLQGARELDRVADVRQDRRDLAAQEDEGHDRDDGDEREDQRVLRETLALLVLADRGEQRGDERHEGLLYECESPGDWRCGGATVPLGVTDVSASLVLRAVADTDEGLDRPALVHRRVRVCDVLEVGLEVEHPPRVDGAGEHTLEQRREVGTDGGAATLEADVVPK